MTLDFNKKKAVIVLGIILAMIGLVFVLVIFTGGKTKKAVLMDITGKVIVTDEDYVIMESNGSDYLVSNIKGRYRVGDEVKFSYLDSDFRDDDSLKTIKIQDEELIRVLETGEVSNKDDNREIIEEESKPVNDTTVYKEQASNINTDREDKRKDNIGLEEEVNSYNEDKGADLMVLSYMEDLEKDFRDISLGEKLKSGFVTVVDFLFYGGNIKGYTFKELSSSAKLKVLAMALYFDQKIDKYFPGYKDSISSTTSKVYNNVRNLIVKSYLEITTNVCKNNTELCSDAKDMFGKLKTNLGLTWDLIKDVASDGIGSLKSWYEIWRG